MPVKCFYVIPLERTRFNMLYRSSSLEKGLASAGEFWYHFHRSLRRWLLSVVRDDKNAYTEPNTKSQSNFLLRGCSYWDAYSGWASLGDARSHFFGFSQFLAMTAIRLTQSGCGAIAVGKVHATGVCLPSECLGDAKDQVHHNDPQPKISGTSRPLYRRFKGRDTFTGITVVGNAYTKLHDPTNGNLDGAGHVMAQLELQSELFHYDRSCILLPIKNLGQDLVDFSDDSHKSMHEWLCNSDTSKDDFDRKYPFSEPSHTSNGLLSTPLIRRDDEVKVVVFGQTEEGQVYLERFWVRVISHTATGIVTGFACAKCTNVEIDEDDLVSFPGTHVMGQAKGQYWAKDNTVVA